MNGKSMLDMVYSQKSEDKFAGESETIVPAVFVAALLFVVVFVVGAAFDIAWVHLQQWYQAIAAYSPF